GSPGWFRLPLGFTRLLSHATVPGRLRGSGTDRGTGRGSGDSPPATHLVRLRVAPSSPKIWPEESLKLVQQAPSCSAGAPVGTRSEVACPLHRAGRFLLSCAQSLLGASSMTCLARSPLTPPIAWAATASRRHIMAVVAFPDGRTPDPP